MELIVEFELSGALNWARSNMRKNRNESQMNWIYAPHFDTKFKLPAGRSRRAEPTENHNAQQSFKCFYFHSSK